MKTSTCIRVAYAEDHDLVRKGIISLVTDPGSIEFVLEASNGEELLQALTTMPTKPDVCLLDINMNNMDGFETTRRIKDQWPGIGVLALTMNKSEHYMVRMFQNGADGYLLKSTSPTEVRNAIKGVHEYGYYYSQIATRTFVQSVLDGTKHMPALTLFEENVMKFCCSELTYKEIGDVLGRNEKSIKNCVEYLFKKFDARNRSHLVLQAVTWGLAGSSQV